MKYRISEQEVEEINRILNQRGNQSVKIKIEEGKIVIFAVFEKQLIKE